LQTGISADELRGIYFKEVEKRGICERKKGRKRIDNG
jgi:hypothetical protein